MSFVIKDEIEKGQETKYVFDEVPYNYLFNKSTSFIDGDFVKNDH